MYAVASVLCKTLQMSFSVDPGVRYLSDGPTISALASVNIILNIHIFYWHRYKYSVRSKVGWRWCCGMNEIIQKYVYAVCKKIILLGCEMCVYFESCL